MWLFEMVVLLFKYIFNKPFMVKSVLLHDFMLYNHFKCVFCVKLYEFQVIQWPFLVIIYLNVPLPWRNCKNIEVIQVMYVLFASRSA